MSRLQDLLRSARTAIDDALAESDILRVITPSDLQKAVDAAQPGQTIRVKPGTYPPLTLRPKPPGVPILLRPDVDDASLPPIDVSPRTPDAFSGCADALITIQPQNGRGVKTDPAACGYRLMGLHVLSPGLDGTMIDLGTYPLTDLAQQPHDIEVDRCWLNGADTCKRGVSLNGQNLSLVHSIIDGVLQAGKDTQGVHQWTGSGANEVLGNYIRAATEGVLIGGADPVIQGLIPTDLTIRDNIITKKPEWQALRGVVKNGLELKNVRQVLIEHNLIEYAWTDGQSGNLVLMTVRDQGGLAPWSTIQDVVMRYNICRHANQGLQILGLDDQKSADGSIHASERMRDVTITQNLFYDVGGTQWGGGSTRGVWVNNGPVRLAFTRNTMVGAYAAWLGLLLGHSQTRAAGLIVTDNIASEGQYGITADGTAPGLPAWTATVDAASQFDRNLILLSAPRATFVYPGTTTHITSRTEALDPQYRSLVGAVGADVDELLRRLPWVTL